MIIKIVLLIFFGIGVFLIVDGIRKHKTLSLKEWIASKKYRKRIKPPSINKDWTTIYYGKRGSGKTLHQAKEVLHILKYLEYLYYKYPKLNRAIVFSVQRFSPYIEAKYKKYLFYWNDAKDLRFCPRKNCWRGKNQHRLHGCYLIFDDIATILPADNWVSTPMWLRKTFSQARHFGIRILANLQDPFSCDINFRRYTDMAYKFEKVIGSRDPDETRNPIKRIWGVYRTRKIPADILWQYGDLTNEQIVAAKEQSKELKKAGKLVLGHTGIIAGVFKAKYHWISRKICKIYDTTQDVPEYKPSGYEHHELKCIDSRHNHTDPKAPNYCGFKKVSHDIV